MRQLVFSSGASSRHCSPSLSQSLIDCLTGKIVAPFTTHHLVQKRSVYREKRRSLLSARSVVAIQPVHHEPELQTGGEWRRNVSLHTVNADIPRRDLGESLFQPRHIERVLKDFSIGLHQNRKTGKPSHDLK